MPKKTTRRRACEGARPVSASRRSDDQPPTADTDVVLTFVHGPKTMSQNALW